ncbi:MAG TPA: HEAT repeat domain-containing protein [Anaerolineae bacterium]|nr:HEAT repeat domain-containing protein [Anaerolineae bacterium]
MNDNSWFRATLQVPELMELLASQDLDDRLTAIQVLGEIGDEQALGALKARMTSPLEEYYALSVAVGKLKKRLGAQ